ncbi:DUF397 domain-containing protein [Streptomyces sp. NPDC058682]|uniref:DUF397 domain-containing protein n=1 Tax=unclassified Streptomyces TaxID=2593676 RepID=UPI002252DE90|nr:DUF397 domain-containing protein [Streptomyces sp. NBC_01214]MCX4802198.1 DUF397 domain-containing protein [Streptomyces sp. NBC_01214]
MCTNVEGLSWRKSSYSNSDSASCVEISDDFPGVVPVRDTKLAGAGPVLLFPVAAWAPFIRAVKGRG